LANILGNMERFR